MAAIAKARLGLKRFIRRVTSANPAADAVLTETVDDGEVWRLLSMRFDLATSATAGSRQIVVTIKDASTTLFQLVCSVTQAASLTYTYQVQPITSVSNLTINDTARGIIIPMPDVLLPAGTEIEVSAINTQTGDDFTAAELLVEASLVEDTK